MDAVLTPNRATEQSIAANKKQIRMKTPKRNGGGNFLWNSSENIDAYAGFLNPPSRAMSLSSTYSYYLPSSTFNHQQQPPLLPLPHVSPIQPLLSRSRSSQGLLIPPPNRKIRTKDMYLTPKKSKPTKREEVNKRLGTQSIVLVASDNRWGPDPKDLPKHLPVVLTSKVKGNLDEVFNLSPPPSSLPLPKFSLRSKLGCNTEAAGGSVDAGATNNLRRLLRLR
ncbi:hypothetical protein VNO77_11440 [Canavalia gladiata]|uniref:Uncharacterized protein n=1 Tax=Canavalia gladiata TaxID=3824 RepID=A0AAN9MCX0_CANGL